METPVEVGELLTILHDTEEKLSALVGRSEAEALLLLNDGILAERDRRGRAALEKFAHDLSNILAPVQMSAYLLHLHVEGGEGEEILSAMEASVTQGMELVQRAFGLARDGARK